MIGRSLERMTVNMIRIRKGKIKGRKGSEKRSGRMIRRGERRNVGIGIKRRKRKEARRRKGKKREKHKDREKDRESDKDRERGREKTKDIEREKEADQDKERASKKSHDDHDRIKDDGFQMDSDDQVHGDIQKRGKVSLHVEDEQIPERTSGGAQASVSELEERILKMKEERTKKKSEVSSDVLAWVSRSRKLAENKNAKHLLKIFEEQDNIVQGDIEDEEAGEHNSHDLAGVKALHDLDKVMEGGAVVLTLEEQNILADGDINEEAVVLENVEIGVQKRRDEAYKAAKKKTGIYDDKFNDDPASEKKILPQYDDSTADEDIAFDERGRFTGEAEKKLEELCKRLFGASTNNRLEDLNSSGKSSSDYYTHEEILQFKKPKKKKSLRKKEMLDLDALEAEAFSAGSGVGDLGSRKDGRRQAIREEKEISDVQMRNSVYQSAFAKADEASKLLRLKQTVPTNVEEEENPVFAEDDEDLYKSPERATKLALEKQEAGISGPQAVAHLATAPLSSQMTDDQNPETGESQEKKLVLTEMEEFVSAIQLAEECHRPDNENGVTDEAEPLRASDEEQGGEAGGWNEVQETSKNENVVIHEVHVGKGLSGALKLLKEQGTLKVSIDWGGRNMDKKKSKLVAIVDNDADDKTNDNKFKDIWIDRTNEFGRFMTPKEAFRVISHIFHGKGPGKMKQEKHMKQYEEELKLKQMENSDTPSLSVERMRETQAQQTSDTRSGFATAEKDVPGGMTPMLGDKKVEHFLGIKCKPETGSSSTQENPIILPNDVLRTIASKLPLKSDLLRMSMVCQQWKDIAFEEIRMRPRCRLHSDDVYRIIESGAELMSADFDDMTAPRRFLNRVRHVSSEWKKHAEILLDHVYF